MMIGSLFSGHFTHRQQEAHSQAMALAQQKWASQGHRPGGYLGLPNGVRPHDLQIFTATRAKVTSCPGCGAPTHTHHCGYCGRGE